jgi:diguanylate cyclase (GGDEF)-like protein
VDRLGHLRDLHGYEAKEEVLSAIIAMLKSTTRGSDFLGRLADDRLLAVVPHTDIAGARAMAARLLAGADALDFEGGGRTLRVTLSLGISYSTEEATLFYDSMLQSAEDGLAEAVTAGGARFVVKAPHGAPM